MEPELDRRLTKIEWTTQDTSRRLNELASYVTDHLLLKIEDNQTAMSALRIQMEKDAEFKRGYEAATSKFRKRDFTLIGGAVAGGGTLAGLILQYLQTRGF